MICTLSSDIGLFVVVTLKVREKQLTLCVCVVSFTSIQEALM